LYLVSDPRELVFVFKKGFKDGLPSDKEVPTSMRKFTAIIAFSHCWKHVTFVSKGERISSLKSLTKTLTEPSLD